MIIEVCHWLKPLRKVSIVITKPSPWMCMRCRSKYESGFSYFATSLWPLIWSLLLLLISEIFLDVLEVKYIQIIYFATYFSISWQEFIYNFTIKVLCRIRILCDTMTFWQPLFWKHNCDGETHDLEQGKMPRKKIGQFENRFIQLLKLAPCELSFHYLPLKMTSKLSFVSIHAHSFCPQCHFFLDILIIDKCSSSLNCWLSTKSRINWRVCHLEPNFFCPNLFQ